jgi:hypothetical protein
MMEAEDYTFAEMADIHFFYECIKGTEEGPKLIPVGHHVLL